MIELRSRKIKSDVKLLPLVINHYSKEYEKAKSDVKISLMKLEREKVGTSHVFEHRLSQLQDLEEILKILNIKLSMTKKSIYKKLLENKSDTEVKHSINADQDVLSLENSINELALIRNLFLGILKGLHVKSSSVNLCIRMRKDNMDIILD